MRPRRHLSILVLVVAAGCGRASTSSPGDYDTSGFIDSTMSGETLLSDSMIEPQTSTSDVTKSSILTVGPSADTTAPVSPVDSWDIRGGAPMTVALSLPPDARVAPRVKELTDEDIAGGLFLLQGWIFPKCACIVALSIQRDPGDAAPVHHMTAYRTVSTKAGEWRFVDFGGGGQQNIVAFARIDGYLFEVTAPGDAIAEAVVDSISVVAATGS